MDRVVQFPLDDGGSVLVRVSDDPFQAEEVTRGLGGPSGVLGRAQETFEETVSQVLPAAQGLVRRLRSALDSPDEITVEFGVELNAQAGAILASASSAASLRVSVSWKGSADKSRPAERAADGDA
jgi:Trypsin-co-occurring domain 1